MGNPWTDLTGPQFLAVFAIVITGCAILCWWRRKGRDASASLPPFVPPTEIDPYEAAYLRAGGNEVARVLIVRLIERRYLHIVTFQQASWRKASRRRIERNPNHPAIEGLAPLERAAFDWFRTPRTAEEIFAKDGSMTSNDLVSLLPMHTIHYEKRLLANQLISTDEERKAAKSDVMLAFTVLLLIGLTRLFIGLHRGRPIVFLVMMSIAGLVAIVSAGAVKRLSRRGQQYLSAIQTRHSWLNSVTHDADWSASLTAGFFGVSALAGTEMADLSVMFNRSAHSGNISAGGCGGACGGGGCGGGGCGGGCGGCGGCGG